MSYGLGARPSLPDHRDRLYRFAAVTPVSVDLREDGPVIWDQGDLGSCVPHGVLRAVNHSEKVQDLTVLSPSALFTYYVGREIEGTVDEDSGLYVRDGIKATNKGVATRWDWPYNVDRFTEKPPQSVYDNAVDARTLEYARIVDLNAVHSALQARQPVVFGFTVYQSFEDIGSDGRMPMPSADEAPLGGHCNVIVGYRFKTDDFIVANSWSTGWGDEGFYYMPVQVFTTLAFSEDIWVVRKVA
jgi:C1A family cysteine protease